MSRAAALRLHHGDQRPGAEDLGRSLQVVQAETTVYETARHRYRFVANSYPDEDREIVTERRLFDVRCDALLIDLRGRHAACPDLMNRRSYVFT